MNIALNILPMSICSYTYRAANAAVCGWSHRTWFLSQGRLRYVFKGNMNKKQGMFIVLLPCTFILPANLALLRTSLVRESIPWIHRLRRCRFSSYETQNDVFVSRYVAFPPRFKLTLEHVLTLIPYCRALTSHPFDIHWRWYSPFFGRLSYYFDMINDQYIVASLGIVESKNGQSPDL